MSKWSKFYESRLTPKYLSHLLTHYKPFLDLIASYNGTRSTFAEYGCGAGNITKILLEDYKVNNSHCLDSDTDILQIAMRNIDSNTVSYEKADIRDISSKRFDVLHSHGVLEHLSDEAISQAITAQKKQANTLIHYVPSNKYETQSFGDERLLSKEQWAIRHKPTKIIEFNKGYDLILIWERT